MEGKVRADKKTSVNPIVTLEIYDALCRLAYVCDAPLKAVGEAIVSISLNSRPVIQSLSVYFRRPFSFSEYVLLNGDTDKESLKKVLGPQQQRISLKFAHEQYKRLKDLCYALDVALTRATALLIEHGMHNQQVIGEVLTRFVVNKLEPRRMNELRKTLGKINAQSGLELVSYDVVLGYLYVQLYSKPITMIDMVNDWIEDITS